MNPVGTLNRPTLPEALDAWKKMLAERGFSPELLWIFEENLCFEKAPQAPGGFHPGFQIRFTPVPDDALDIAFDHFCESDTRIVFYRLGEARQRSVCILLGDAWFNGKGSPREITSAATPSSAAGHISRGENDGYIRRDEWRMSFHPGRKEEIEEVTDMGRWLRRIKRERPLHDLDFCMALAAIDEIKMHGRVLAPYERFAENIVGKLRRIFAHAE
jgi:hypothetical protein